MGVLADARSQSGDQRHPLAAADERDDDLPGARGGEVDALVGAGEELVEHAVEAPRQLVAAGGGDEAPGLAGEVVGAVAGMHDEALLAERVEQGVGRRRALAERLGDLVGTQPVVGAREQRQQREHGARGADAASAAAVAVAVAPAADLSVMVAPLLLDGAGRGHSTAGCPCAAGTEHCITAALHPRNTRLAARLLRNSRKTTSFLAHRNRRH